MQVSLYADREAEALLDEREALRDLERVGELDGAGQDRLLQVEAEYDEALARIGGKRDQMAAAVGCRRPV